MVEPSGPGSETNLPKELEHSIDKLNATITYWKEFAVGFRSSPPTPESLEELNGVVTEWVGLRADVEDITTFP